MSASAVIGGGLCITPRNFIQFPVSLASLSHDIQSNQVITYSNVTCISTTYMTLTLLLGQITEHIDCYKRPEFKFRLEGLSAKFSNRILIAWPSLMTLAARRTTYRAPALWHLYVLIPLLNCLSSCSSLEDQC